MKYGKVRRATHLGDRVWVGVRETDQTFRVHNLFLEPTDTVFTKDDPISWEGEDAYYMDVKYKILQTSPGIVPTRIKQISFQGGGIHG